MPLSDAGAGARDAGHSWISGSAMRVDVVRSVSLGTGGTSGSVDQGLPATLGNAWPFKLTDGSETVDIVGSALSITGTVGLSAPIVISSVTLLPDVKTQSGSLVSLLYGGQPASSQNPLWMTGTIGVTNHPSSTTMLSGSVVGSLVGGQPVSLENPVPTQAIEAPNVQYRYDFGATTIYTGYAARLAATSAPVWTIKRTLLDGSGNATEARWSITSSWDSRASLSYT